MESVDIAALKDTLLQYCPEDILTAGLNAAQDYTKYQQDPVGFAKDVLDITVTGDVAEMLESVRDNRITVCRSATGTGKSHGASVASSWFYKAFPDSRVYTTANPYENQKILWGELSSIIEHNKNLFSNDKVTGFNVERSSKDFITALTVPTTGTDTVKEGKFSGKHHKHMLFIVDEGDTVPDFAYRGIDGCMSGGLIVRLLILYNPRHEAGEPYRLEREGAANVIHLSAFSHPNVTSGEEIIPGAVNRPTTVQRINEWCRPLVAGEERTSDCFSLPGFLVGSTASYKSGKGVYSPLKAGVYMVTEPAFHYMVLGQFPPQPARQLISREWVNRARARYDVYVSEHGLKPPFGVRPVLGADIAEFGTDKNVSCLRYGGFVPPMTDWGGVDTLVTADRLASEYNQFGVLIAYIDATGVGTGVAPAMNRLGCTATGVKVAKKPTEECEMGAFAQLRDQLWWACREWLKTDLSSMLPPDEELIQELLTPTYGIANGVIKIMPKNPPSGRQSGAGTGVVCMRDLLKRSPDRAEALIMTFFPETGESLYGDLGSVFH